MGFRLERAAFVSALIASISWGACGGRTDLTDLADGQATTDASLDGAKKDSSALDAAPDVYQPIGKKCGVQDGGPPPVWAPDDSGAPLHPPIMMNYGGATLHNPILIPMTFDGDDLRDPIEDYIASIGCTSYWRATTSDYGIGDAVMGQTVHLSETPPSSIDDSAIATFIKQKIIAKTIPTNVEGQSFYLIFYPETTEITLQGEQSCQSFGGYHNQFAIGAQTVAYAVIPRCGNFDGLGGFDAVTGTTSHELLEGVTDPYPTQSPAYLFPEGNGLAWGLVGGGEVGDLCIFADNPFFMPSDFPFYVQHTWVSHSAFQGHDPCQPVTDTYFNAAPILPDVIAIPPDFGLGNGLTSTGIKIGVGQNKTIDVTLFSDASWTGTVTLDARDYAYFMGGPAALTFNFSKNTAHVGDTVQLTINRVGTNQQFGLEPFVIRSSSQGQREQWWTLVGDP